MANTQRIRALGQRSYPRKMAGFDNYEQGENVV